MNRETARMLGDELIARGFSPAGSSPNDSLVTEDYLASIELEELLDVMVTRREKAWRLYSQFPASSRATYEDSVRCIEAIKAVIRRMSLPP